MTAQAADALMSIFGFERVTLHADDESGKTAAHGLGGCMSDKMREEFEARFPVPWGLEFDDEKYVAKMPHYDRFIAERHNAMFEAWVASRAALVVELPPSMGMPDEDELDYEEFEAMEAITCTANGMRHACRNAIHAAGVKTK